MTATQLAKELRAEMAEQKIYLNQRYVVSLIQKNPGILKDANEVGYDTSTREWFHNLLAEDCGLHHWPIGADGPGVWIAFKVILKDQLEAKGQRCEMED